MTMGEAIERAKRYVSAAGNRQPERTRRVTRACSVLATFKWRIIRSRTRY